MGVGAGGRIGNALAISSDRYWSGGCRSAVVREQHFAVTAGPAMNVDFDRGQEFLALNGGSIFKFTEATPFSASSRPQSAQAAQLRQVLEDSLPGCRNQS